MTEDTQRTASVPAKERASGVAQAGGQVAQGAVEQGKQVAQETGRQVGNLVSEAQGRLTDQAGTQQRRAAETLHSLGDELRQMADRADQGTASDLAAQAAQRVHRAADWLDQREPGQLLDEVRDLARRHPGMFLAGAAALGVLAGRLTRNIASETGHGGETAAPVTSIGGTASDEPTLVAPPVAGERPVAATVPAPAGSPRPEVLP